MIEDAIAFLPVLLSGVVTTVLLTVCALAFSILLGLFWALLGRARSAAFLLDQPHGRGGGPGNFPDHRAAVLHLLRAARPWRDP